MKPCEFSDIDLPDLANFITLVRADVVLVDGPRGAGKTEVIDQLCELLPRAARYEAAAHHGEVHEITRAILGPHHGLDVGQARLGALDFLEQVPVEGVVVFDRSPLSSVVYEPLDPASRAEVDGWVHRARTGRLRQVLLVITDEGPAARDPAPLPIASALKAFLTDHQDLPMHVFTAAISFLRGRPVVAIRARHLTPRWKPR